MCFVLCGRLLFVVFFFKQKTAYEMRISDWSSDVCSSDLRIGREAAAVVADFDFDLVARLARRDRYGRGDLLARRDAILERLDAMIDRVADDMDQRIADILHHFAVEFDLAAARLKGDLLAHVLRETPDAARHRREQLFLARHPQLVYHT